jgi:oligoendopeptidase F
MHRWMRLACILGLLPAFLQAWGEFVPDDTDPAQGTVWDLRPLFADAAAWDKEREQVEVSLASLAALKGSLGSDPKSLQSGLDFISAVRQRLRRLDEYAHLKADEDTRIEENEARVQVVTGLQARFEEAISFVNPEILASGRERVEAFEKSNPGLRSHQRPLELILRKQAHTLSPEAESVLAAAGDLRQQPSQIHDIFAFADIPWPRLQVGDRKVLLNPAGYFKTLENPDREVRRKAFEGFTGTLSSYQRTLGAVLAAYLTGASFEAKARHYPTSLALALSEEAMPEEPFHTLVAETDKSRPTIRRYIQLRKRMLHVDQMYLYDLYVPLVPDPHRYQLDEAEDMILKAVAPLGDDYVQNLSSGFRGHFMHAIAQPGKAARTYMEDEAYGAPPYIMTTFTGNFDSVEAVAHEWGHGMHSRMAQSSQPFETAEYSAFLADAPSLTNEMLLNDYRIIHATTKPEKILALSEAIDTLRASYFNVALYAEFEIGAHEASDHGEPLTGERFSILYCGLLKRFYGETGEVLKIDDSACPIWANVGAVYFDFYIYKYLTATSAAAYFVEGLEKNDSALRAQFFEMLKAGGSDDPAALLKRAGFDPALPSAYEPMGRRLERLVSQLETVLNQPE